MTSKDLIQWRREVVAETWQAYAQLRATHSLPPEFQDLMTQLHHVASEGICDSEILRNLRLEIEERYRGKQSGTEAEIFAVMAEVLVREFNTHWIDCTNPDLPRGFWTPVLDQLSYKGIVEYRQSLSKFMDGHSDRWQQVNEAIGRYWRERWRTEALESLQEP